MQHNNLNRKWKAPIHNTGNATKMRTTFNRAGGTRTMDEDRDRTETYRGVVYGVVDSGLD